MDRCQHRQTKTRLIWWVSFDLSREFDKKCVKQRRTTWNVYDRNLSPTRAPLTRDFTSINEFIDSLKEKHRKSRSCNSWNIFSGKHKGHIVDTNLTIANSNDWECVPIADHKSNFKVANLFAFYFISKRFLRAYNEIKSRMKWNSAAFHPNARKCSPVTSISAERVWIIES